MPNVPNQIYVTYDAENNTFSYSTDWIDPGNGFPCIPGVTHVNFFLQTTGNGSIAPAVFQSTPFYWPGGQPTCITGVNLAPSQVWATFTDSYSGDYGGMGIYPFQVQISYNNRNITSNDPTIINETI